MHVESCCDIMMFHYLQPCVGGDAYQNRKRISGLSISWDLPGTDKMTIWKTCDKSYVC